MPARIFISTAGDNANNGETAGAPVATFRQAIINVDDGGTIEIIDSNTHSPSDSFDNRAVVNKSVDIVPSSGQTPILDGAAAHTAGRPGFAGAATCTLTFTGITFQNWGAGNTSYLVNQANAVTLQYNQCTFKSIAGVSIFYDPPTATSGTPNKLDRCRVERTTEKKLFDSPPGGDWHFLIQNSVLHYAGTDSGQVYIDAQNNNHVNGIVRNCSLLVEVNSSTGASDGVIRCGTIENVIIRNAATSGGNAAAALKAKGGYSNNCIFGNFTTGEVSTGASTTGLVTGNPLFVNEGAEPPDLKLQAGSPCIGTGKTIAAVTVDFDGTSRSAPYDIGAFVFTSTAVAFTDDGSETYSRKFGSNSFEIHATANKLATRGFADNKDNRQAPFSVTVAGPATIRRRTTPYKSET